MCCNVLNMTTLTPSTHATAATELRKRLKAAGIKASVRSSCFAGGNAIDVNLNNASDETVQLANNIAALFKKGHFDGMTDSYRMDNVRTDVPAQVMFVCVNNHQDE